MGYWKEQGEAFKVGNKYFAEVNHFTWWNCDLPLDYVNLCFSITSGTSEASTPYLVLMKRNSTDQIIYFGNVQSIDGAQCRLIPQNEEITLSIYSTGGKCNNQLVHE
ncbi:hypothetical protein [Psychroserpens burtonensis]|uniref:hypothetical protein n=1 Tax=Psychroserpens burtonensis TaxID=49278 RepID=UPI00042A1251|nr:hypothetical protein [Psychroserpens burtonensis]